MKRKQIVLVFLIVCILGFLLFIPKTKQKETKTSTKKKTTISSGWTGSDTAASCLTLSGSITSGRLTPSGKFRQVVRQLWKASGLRRRDMK